MIGFIALDQILGLFFRGMVGVALERHVGNNFLHDSTPNSACFRIPCHVVAPFESLRHVSLLTER